MSVPPDRTVLGASISEVLFSAEAIAAKVTQILGHRSQAVRFGKKAIELGHLKPHQVEALLNYQRTLQKRIGQYFVEKGLLSDAEANRISQQLTKHNIQISQRTRIRAENRC